MQLDQYDLVHNPNNTFEFYSSGPNGLIKKVVRYSVIDFRRQVYNLSFGDWDEEKRHINDRAVSNNNDREKILPTVAATVLVFFKKNPNAVIIALGSTPVRNRLYQIGIQFFGMT